MYCIIYLANYYYREGEEEEVVVVSENSIEDTLQNGRISTKWDLINIIFFIFLNFLLSNFVEKCFFCCGWERGCRVLLIRVCVLLKWLIIIVQGCTQAADHHHTLVLENFRSLERTFPGQLWQSEALDFLKNSLLQELAVSWRVPPSPHQGWEVGGESRWFCGDFEFRGSFCRLLIFLASEVRVSKQLKEVSVMGIFRPYTCKCTVYSVQVL